MMAVAGEGARATYAWLAALGAEGAAEFQILAAAAAGGAFADADIQAGIQ
jgi:membrane protein required for beta-lactamase induction